MRDVGDIKPPLPVEARPLQEAIDGLAGLVGIRPLAADRLPEMIGQAGEDGGGQPRRRVEHQEEAAEKPRPAAPSPPRETTPPVPTPGRVAAPAAVVVTRRATPAASLVPTWRPA